jgi:hypothetical protein
MNASSRLIKVISRVVCAVCLVFIGGSAAHAEDGLNAIPKNAAELFERLQQRDKQFDNLSLVVEKIWVDKINPAAFIAKSQFDAMRFSMKPPEVPKIVPEPYDQLHRVPYTLTVRGSEVTFEGADDLEVITHPEFTFVPAHNLKWTTVGGVEQVYDESSDGKSSHLRKRSSPKPNTRIEFDRDRLQFALGFGVTRQLESLDQFHVDARGTIICSGPYRIGGEIAARCDLELDANLIVRKVTIFNENNGGYSRMVSTSKGTFHVEGIPALATSGHFQRVIKSPPQADHETAESVQEEEDYQLIGAQPRLTEKEYADRTRIVIRPNTRVTEEGVPTMPQAAPKIPPQPSGSP